MSVSTIAAGADRYPRSRPLPAEPFRPTVPGNSRYRSAFLPLHARHHAVCAVHKVTDTISNDFYMTGIRQSRAEGCSLPVMTCEHRPRAQRGSTWTNWETSHPDLWQRRLYRETNVSIGSRYQG
jgi:hypothetical protein